MFLLLLYLNSLTLFAFINIEPSNFLPWWNSSDSKGLKYIKYIFLFLLPGYFFIKIFIKESEIKNSNYTEQKIHLGYILLITYGVLSFILFFVAITLK